MYRISNMLGTITKLTNKICSVKYYCKQKGIAAAVPEC